MKAKSIIFAAVAMFCTVGCSGQATECQKPDNQSTENVADSAAESVVYMTTEITPDALMRVYHALGVKAEGRVAVKISTANRKKPTTCAPSLSAILCRAWAEPLSSATRPTRATATPTRSTKKLSRNAATPTLPKLTLWTRRARCESPCATAPI